MALKVGDLFVRLGMDMTEFSKGFQNAQKELEKQSRVFKDTGASLTAAITLPLAGLAVAGTTAFAGFEQAMNRVSALGEIFGADLEKLNKQAMDLGAKTQYSAKQAAEAMGNLAASGFKANEIFQAMPGVLALAATENMKIADAAQIASDVIKGFGFAAQDMQKVADVLAKTSASSATSVQDLGFAFSYVGPVAKAVGADFLDVAAALGVLGDAGIRGERGGTALRNIFNDLLASTPKAKEAMKALNIHVTDVNGKLKPMAELIKELQPLLHNTVAAQAIFGQRWGEIVPLLEKGGAAFAKTRKEIESFQGAADAMAKIIRKGVAGNLEEFMSSIETAAIQLGKALAPIANDLLKFGAKVAGVLGDMAEWFGKLPEPMKTFTIAVAALAAALGPLLFILGSFMGAVANLKLAAPILMSIAKGLKAIATVNAVSALGSLKSAGAALVPVLAMLGKVALVAAAAFAGWKLGEWLYNNVGFLRKFGDAVADMVLKLDWVNKLIEKYAGVNQATANLDFATKKLEEALKRKGVVIDKTGLSLDQYAAKLRDAAKNVKGVSVETSGASKTTAELEAYAKKLRDAYKGGGEEAGKHRKTLSELEKQMLEVAKAGDRVRDMLEDLPKNYQEFSKAVSERAFSPDAAIKQLSESYRDLARQWYAEDEPAVRAALSKTLAKIRENRDAVEEWKKKFDMEEAIKGIEELALKLGQVDVKDIPVPKLLGGTEIEEAEKKFDKIAEAAKRFGGELDRAGLATGDFIGKFRTEIEELDKAWIAVRDSGGFTQAELTKMYAKYAAERKKIEKDAQDYIRGQSAQTKYVFSENWLKFQEELTKSMERFKEIVGSGLKSVFDNLFTGNFSGALERLKGVGKDLLGAMDVLLNPIKQKMYSLIDELTKQITGFVTKTLLGAFGGGLSSVLGKIPLVGDAIGKVFGVTKVADLGKVVLDLGKQAQMSAEMAKVAAQTAKTVAEASKVAAEVTTTAAQAASTASQAVSTAASTASKAGSAVASTFAKVGNVMNVVSGAISAVTGVLSYLQGRRMEQDIGRIEVTSREIFSQSLAIQETLNKWLPGISGIHDAVYQYFDYFAQLMTTEEEALAVLNRIYDVLRSGVKLSGEPSGEAPPVQEENTEATQQNTEATEQNTETQTDNTEQTEQNSGATQENTETQTDNTEQTEQNSGATQENTEVTYSNSSATVENAEAQAEAAKVAEEVVDSEEYQKKKAEQVGRSLGKLSDAADDSGESIARTGSGLAADFERTGDAVSQSAGIMRTEIVAAARDFQDSVQDGIGSALAGVSRFVLDAEQVILGKLSALDRMGGDWATLQQERARLTEQLNSIRGVTTAPASGGAFTGPANPGQVYWGGPYTGISSTPIMTLNVSVNNADAQTVANKMVSTWRSRGVDI